jgi:hypothetical protein
MRVYIKIIVVYRYLDTYLSFHIWLWYLPSQIYFLVLNWKLYLNFGVCCTKCMSKLSSKWLFVLHLIHLSLSKAEVAHHFTELICVFIVVCLYVSFWYIILKYLYMGLASGNSIRFYGAYAPSLHVKISIYLFIISHQNPCIKEHRKT